MADRQTTVVGNEASSAGSYSPLRNYEERFRLLSSVATEGLMIHHDQVIIEANLAFAKILGLGRPEDLIGLNGMEVIRFTHDSKERLGRHMKSGSGEPIDIEIVRPDGKVVPVETRGQEMELEDRTVRLVYMRDISERKQADEALRESERNYREIFNATSDALFIHNENGLILDVNEAMCTMFRCDRDWAIGKSADEFSLGVSPYSQTEVAQMLMKAEAEGARTFLWRSKRRDGELFWSEVALRSCTIAGQQRVIASVRDVDERKKMEDDLSDEKLFAEALFESLPGVAYAYDEDGRIVRWNSQFETVFRRPGQDFTVGSVTALSTIAEWDRERVSGFIDVILRDGHGSEEIQILTGEGREMPYLASARSVEFRGKRYLVGVGFDISERVQSEQEKDRLQEQLLHAGKMEAVGQLAGGVAHDFNNLLTIIAGNAELAQSEVADSPQLKPFLDQVSHAATSGSILTQQLLAFSRKQILEPQNLDLNELVARVQTLLARLIGDNIEVRTRLERDLGKASIDPTQFEQILVNLAVNARDAMPDGGRIVIETANVQISDHRSPDHPDLEPGPYVRLSLSDSGKGMERALLTRIFEPFFTTKAPGYGTGLGLATTLASVQQFDGTIDVQSKIGQGTTFHIYLPRILGTEAGAEKTAVDGSPSGGGETVLLVEDNDKVRELAEEFLKRRGYKVLSMGSGREALALAAAHSGPIDLLLTDMMMPGLSGRETAEKLAAIRPGVKVLYMSGYTDDMVLRQGVADEKINFLAKPFSMKTLAEKLQEVLAP